MQADSWTLIEADSTSGQEQEDDAEILPNNSPVEQTSLLFELPFELRLAIYQYVIDDFYANAAEPHRHRNQVSRRAQYANNVKEHSNAMHPLYPLLFVCQRFRQEVATVLYKSPALKFGSPHRCLFFLRWTASNIHLLHSLRVSVTVYDSFSLESIFDLVLEERAPLQKLAIDFLETDVRTTPLPSDRLLPKLLGQEAPKQAQSRAMKLNTLFEKDLDPNYRFFPRIIRTPADIAQCSFTSSLGRIKTLRYLETTDRPKGAWAVEFELAVLRLHARIFETAANEGKKVVRHGVHGWYARAYAWKMEKRTNWQDETWWEMVLQVDGRYEHLYFNGSDI